jgi:DNA helicase TIP49 (TBP-interacting protein)
MWNLFVKQFCSDLISITIKKLKMLNKLLRKSKNLQIRSFGTGSNVKRRGKSTCNPVKKYSEVMREDFIQMIQKNPKLIFKTSAVSNIHFLNAVKSEPKLRKSKVKEQLLENIQHKFKIGDA